MPIPPPPPRVQVRNADASVGARRSLNFLAGSGLSRVISDDPANDEVEVTLALNPTWISCCAYGITASIPNGLNTVATFNSERWDTDNQHYTSSANLTGTVSKTASSSTLTGSGTAFLTELSVGQVIDVPGTIVERRVVSAIASDTSLTVAGQAFGYTASGQTATRVNTAFVARTPGRYLIVAQVDFNPNPTGYRRITIHLNAGLSSQTVIGQVYEEASNVVIKQSMQVSKVYDLQQWDFVELYIEQTSGSAVTPTVELGIDFIGVATSLAGGPSVVARAVTVAKTGGQYTTIQGAIDSISDAAENKRYCVVVYPGKYIEQVTMKEYVDVVGVDRQSVQIEYGSAAGAVVMRNYCQLANLTIENSSTEGHWGIVADNKLGVHIRNVSLLAPFGSSRRGAGIKITGTSWATAFLEDVIVNTYTQTNQGIFIQSDGVDLVDCTLKSCFVDALEATTGGAILIDGAEDIHLRDCYSRVSSAAYGLRVINGSVVDVTASYFEAGTQSVEVDATSVVWLTGTPITNSSVTAGGSLAAAGRGVTVTKTAQSIGNTSDTAISFASATTQQANRFNSYWSAGLPTRFTAPHHGWYVLGAFVLFASNATGDRYVNIRKNGSVWVSIDGRPARSGGDTLITASMPMFLNAGDYVEVIVHQTSGGNLNVNCDATFAHWF